MTQSAGFRVGSRILLTGIVCSTLGLAWGKEPAAPASQPVAGATTPRPAPGMGQGMQGLGRGLVEALQNSPGCTGVEVAQTQSRKQVIFAWFENKAAALEWYRHPMHMGLTNSMFQDRKQEYTPLKNVPDDAGPILTIACITPRRPTDPELPGMPMFNQISIELYAPLEGGFSVNGSFTPKDVPMKGRVDAQIAPAASQPAVESR